MFVKLLKLWAKNRTFRYTTVAVACAFFGSFAGLLIGYYRELPPLSELEGYKPSLASKIYDINDNLIAQLFVEQRTLVPLDKVPKTLQDALLAVEDENFYSHWGIDLTGIARAIMVNVIHAKVEQGASTITQQLARNLFLTKERTFSRKAKEALLSLKIEYRYTKKEILEMYLNQVYFGSGSYGVEAAARTYFGRHVEEMNLPECALLAGLVRSPNRTSPYNSMERARARRNMILERMIKRKIISKAAGEIAKATQIELHKTETRNAPYFVEYVRQQIEETYGSNTIYKGGLSVHTTLDMRLQDIVQKAASKGLEDAETKIARELGIPVENILSDPEFKKNVPLQYAAVAIDPKTGYIKALIGGRDFAESEFNRAYQAMRQPGSAFKPFIYTAAIDNGFTTADVILDTPLVVTDRDGTEWKPENYEKKFFGPTTIRKGLTYSRNVVTLKLLTKVGTSSAAGYAQKMGIRSKIRKNLSLAFGTSEVNLLELTGAYAAFPNQGVKVQPFSILYIKDSSGKMLEENRPKIQEVLKPETAYIMTTLLEGVTRDGTAKAIKNSGITFQCGGKTGTTDNQSDVWFVGFTSDLVCGIWVGFDDHRSLGQVISSGNTPVPIWAELMRDYYIDPPADFQKPDGIVSIKIDAETGLLAGSKCKNIIEDYFIKGTEPTKVCREHGKSDLFEYKPVTP
ncbi:MAG: PBP1A family penicillin-binding protein [Candidatus Firestonebacteria bacterium]